MGLLDPDPRRPGAAGSWPRVQHADGGPSVIVAAWRPVPPPHRKPPAPIRRTEGFSFTNGWKQPQSHWSGPDARLSKHSGRHRSLGALPLGFVGRSRRGNRAHGQQSGRGGAATEPRDVVGALHVGHPIADGFTVASLEGWPVPASHRLHLAPSRRMRKTLRAWRRMSRAPVDHGIPARKRAQDGGMATPCWPAPVSAMNPLLAHTQGQQGPGQRVVDFCGARCG